MTENPGPPLETHPLVTPQPVITAVQSSRRAWSPTAIAWMSLIFTVLPAAVMYALNFERLGQPERKRLALIMGLLGSAIYYVVGIWSSLVPALERPARSLFLVGGIMIAWRFYLGQQTLFARYTRAGGRRASVVVPVLLSCATIVAAALPVFGWLFWQDYREQQQLDRGGALVKRHRYKEAEAVLKEFQAYDADEPQAYWNLALIYLDTDREALAKQEIETLLKHDPTNATAKKWLRDFGSDIGSDNGANHIQASGGSHHDGD